jgi:hypothetical protein
MAWIDCAPTSLVELTPLNLCSRLRGGPGE